MPHITRKKLGRALKSAARFPFPVRVSGGYGSDRNRLSHLPGESPVVVLCVQILGCNDLAGRPSECDP